MGSSSLDLQPQTKKLACKQLRYNIKKTDRTKFNSITTDDIPKNPKSNKQSNVKKNIKKGRPVKYVFHKPQQGSIHSYYSIENVQTKEREFICNHCKLKVSAYDQLIEHFKIESHRKINSHKNSKHEKDMIKPYSTGDHLIILYCDYTFPLPNKEEVTNIQEGHLFFSVTPNMKTKETIYICPCCPFSSSYHQVRLHFKSMSHIKSKSSVKWSFELLFDLSIQKILTGHNFKDNYSASMYVYYEGIHNYCIGTLDVRPVKEQVNIKDNDNIQISYPLNVELACKGKRRKHMTASLLNHEMSNIKNETDINSNLTKNNSKKIIYTKTDMSEYPSASRSNKYNGNMNRYPEADESTKFISSYECKHNNGNDWLGKKHGQIFEELSNNVMDGAHLEKQIKCKRKTDKSWNLRSDNKTKYNLLKTRKNKNSLKDKITEIKQVLKNKDESNSSQNKSKSKKVASEGISKRKRLQHSQYICNNCGYETMLKSNIRGHFSKHRCYGLLKTNKQILKAQRQNMRRKNKIKVSLLGKNNSSTRTMANQIMGMENKIQELHRTTKTKLNQNIKLLNKLKCLDKQAVTRDYGEIEVVQEFICTRCGYKSNCLDMMEGHKKLCLRLNKKSIIPNTVWDLNDFIEYKCEICGITKTKRNDYLLHSHNHQSALTYMQEIVENLIDLDSDTRFASKDLNSQSRQTLNDLDSESRSISKDLDSKSRPKLNNLDNEGISTSKDLINKRKPTLDDLDSESRSISKDLENKSRPKLNNLDNEGISTSKDLINERKPMLDNLDSESRSISKDLDSKGRPTLNDLDNESRSTSKYLDHKSRPTSNDMDDESRPTLKNLNSNSRSASNSELDNKSGPISNNMKETNFNCHICNEYSSKFSSNLTHHVYKQHRDGFIFKCDYCYFATMNLCILNDHMQYIHALSSTIVYKPFFF